MVPELCSMAVTWVMVLIVAYFIGVCTMAWVTPSGASAPASGRPILVLILIILNLFTINAVFYGGTLRDGSYCGLFNSCCDNAVGFSYWDFGARRIFVISLIV